MSTGTARREGTRNDVVVTASSQARSKRETVAPVIIGEGVRGITQRRYFLLTSRSVPGATHTVYLHSDGHLNCDCPGYFYREECAHTTIVGIRLAEEARCAGEEWSCALTEKGRAYLAQWRREQREQRDRRAEEEYHDRYETARVAEEWR